MLTPPPCGFHGTSRYNILFQIAPNDRDDDDNEKNEGENYYDDCGDGNICKRICMNDNWVHLNS